MVAMRLATVGLTHSTFKAVLQLPTLKPNQRRTTTHLKVTQTYPGHGTRCRRIEAQASMPSRRLRNNKTVSRNIGVGI